MKLSDDPVCVRIIFEREIIPHVAKTVGARTDMIHESRVALACDLSTAILGDRKY